MKVAIATITYHSVVAQPPDNFEVQLLFQTIPNQTYMIQTTTDAETWVDVGPITLPANAKLSWPVDPRVGPWPRLITKD